MSRHRVISSSFDRSAFAGFRFPPEVILLAVRGYLRYGLSYRDVEELLAERGIEVVRVMIYRWVQRFTPLLIDAARPCRHAVGGRWFVDETYVKVSGNGATSTALLISTAKSSTSSPSRAKRDSGQQLGRPTQLASALGACACALLEPGSGALTFDWAPSRWSTRTRQRPSSAPDLEPRAEHFLEDLEAELVRRIVVTSIECDQPHVKAGVGQRLLEFNRVLHRDRGVSGSVDQANLERRVGPDRARQKLLQLGVPLLLKGTPVQTIEGRTYKS